MNTDTAYTAWRRAAVTLAQAVDSTEEAGYQEACLARIQEARARKDAVADTAVPDRDDRYRHGVGSHSEREANAKAAYQAVIDTGYDRIGGVFLHWVEDRLGYWAMLDIAHWAMKSSRFWSQRGLLGDMLAEHRYRCPNQTPCPRDPAMHAVWCRACRKVFTCAS